MDTPSAGFSVWPDFEQKYVRPREGRTLLVGSHIYKDKPDRRKLYPDAVGWDMIEGPGVDRVIDLEAPLPKKTGTFAHIECMSVLEHSRYPWKLAENVESLLVQGGTLSLSVPFVWRVHAYPDDFWRFTTSAIRLIFPQIKWTKLLYANQELTKKVRRIDVDGFWYYPKSEVFGFGVKR